jgi:(E)-4-hydroxy-3-methylbut-2-enyl-diphosphate synthase
VPSAVGLGTLLPEGIGDPIRVSAAGNPLVEVRMAKQILIALSLYENAEPNLQLVVCPTCARAQVDVTRLARKIRRALGAIKKPLRVAVMGCIVNGPGEAADADIAVCTAKTKAYIYRKGRRISIVPERKIIPELMKQLESL